MEEVEVEISDQEIPEGVVMETKTEIGKTRRKEAKMTIQIFQMLTWHV